MGWHVPPLSYLKGRASPAIKYIHGIEDAKSEEIDQEFLYLGVEELLQNEGSYRLQNRERVFRILEGTKKLFLSRFAEKNRLKN